MDGGDVVYLLGDVLRIFAGDFESGIIHGVQATQGMWLVIAGIMLVPIVMIVPSLTLPYPMARWTNIVVAVVLILFNLVALPFDGAYDNLLTIVSFGFNGLTVWYAWTWA